MIASTIESAPSALAPSTPPASAPLALGALFAARVRATPERPALTFEGSTWTYAEVAARVALLAGGLQA